MKRKSSLHDWKKKKNKFLNERKEKAGHKD